MKKAAQRTLAKRELARRHFSDYLAYVHPKWIRTKFSEFLANEVQKFVEADTGNAYDILIIETPPQHGKSLTVTESFPSWYLGKYPDKRVIEVSYNSEWAALFGKKNKEKIEQHGANLFGITLGATQRNERFDIAGHTGQMLSAGILAGVTGNPGDLIIIDDPIKTREEADSETTREKMWGEWNSSIKTRFQAKTKVIVIMTPWHEDDLRARIIKSEANVQIIHLPVEAEENDILGRQPGEPLCPELGKDAAWLEQFKASYLASDKGGRRAWSALYMCNPVIEGGNLVQRSWWKYYDPQEITAFGTEYISVDATFKNTDTSDFVSIQVWGKLYNDYYLRYVLNRRMGFADTLNTIRLIRQIYPMAHTVLIEDKANGSAIIETLNREIPGVVAVTPKGGKVARVNAVSPAIESGHVFLPEGAVWLEEYLKQWSEFPSGKHDDMVDATTQCLNRMMWSSGVAGLPQETPTREERLEKRLRNAEFGEGMFDVYREIDYFEDGIHYIDV